MVVEEYLTQVRIYMYSGGRNQTHLRCMAKHAILDHPKSLTEQAFSEHDPSEDNLKLTGSCNSPEDDRSLTSCSRSVRPSNRWQRAQVAKETLEVLGMGSYKLSSQKVDIASILQNAKDGTIMYPADKAICQQFTNTTGSEATQQPFIIEVTRETTLQAGMRIRTAQQPDSKESVCILNFASAKNPGGGFEGGSLAQEESLACSSGLYACLVQHMDDFYSPHRKDPKDGFYSHAMLYSPEVPFFRDDDSAFCPVWVAGVITAPAPNAGVVMRKHSETDLFEALQERIKRILYLAMEHGHTHLILGAYGCGVFRNDPKQVAAAFDIWLRGDDAIGHGTFKSITFAIPGADGDPNLQAFEERFSDSEVQLAPVVNKARRLKGQHQGSHEKKTCGVGGRRRKDAHHRKYADPND